MNQRPRSSEPTGGDASSGRLRGQSDVLAIVLLLGMVFLGAAAVVVMGGFLIDSVQGSSEHELARDSAIQTHQQIAEALQSGQARELAASDGIDMEVQQTGSIAIEMQNGAGDACSADQSDVDRVDADLGAIVYDTPQGAIVYQGGAIWERTEGGLSIERNPPISYENDSARISVQTVTAEPGSLDERMARPNETMQTAMAEDTNRMLTECPADGYTTLEISVTSPNYAELWKQHFDESVDTGSNVNVTRSGDTVTANISNATSAHASRGLRFDDISAPNVVSNRSNMSDALSVDAQVANDGFASREFHTRLTIDGTSIEATTSNQTIQPGKTQWSNITDSSLQYTDLANHSDLNTSELHSYTIEIVDGEGTAVADVRGEFFLADGSGGALTLIPPNDTLDAGHDTLYVNATLFNTLTTDEETDVQFNITDERVDMNAIPADDVTVSGYGGEAEVRFGPIDVQNLSAGLYEYEVQAAGQTKRGVFAIANRSQPNLAGNLLLESTDAPTMVEAGNGSFEAITGVVNLGSTSANGELELDVEGLPAENASISGLSEYNSTEEPLAIPESDLGGLDVGEVHNYTITLHGDVESTDPVTGSFYLGQSGPSPAIENTTADGNNSTINATIANHGLENVSETATLTLFADDGSPLGSHETAAYHLVPGESRTISFDINESGLAGAYDYRVEFGGESREETINFSGVSGGNDDVTITAPGNGTVTVLGTEVSYSNYHDKYWAPVSVASVLNIDGNQTTHQFYNNATNDPDSLHDLRNLNSYDTQTETYSYDWTQVEGETATLTVASTLWQQSTFGFDPVYYGADDYHPPNSAWNSPYNSVNASSGDSSSNVRALLDGQEVPNVHAAGSEQRSAAEVLNQGTDRVDSDGTLDLGPNEAVFLIELSEENAQWEDADQSGDPDYNDVIVLVGFNPDEPESVSFSVEDGNNLVIGPADPDTGGDNGSESIGGVNSSVNEEGNSGPSAPDASAPDPGDPSESDEIDVDVGGVVIG